MRLVELLEILQEKGCVVKSKQYGNELYPNTNAEWFIERILGLSPNYGEKEITPAEAIEVLVEADFQISKKGEYICKSKETVGKYYIFAIGTFHPDEAIKEFLGMFEPKKEELPKLEDALAHLKQLIAPNVHVQQAIAIIEKHLEVKEDE
jgi:hypothetical protein